MLCNVNYRSDLSPKLDFLLDDSKKSKYVIGRIAKVKVPFKSFETEYKCFL